MIKGIRPQFRLLKKNRMHTETDMVRFDWLLFTDKCCRANQIWLLFIPNHVNEIVQISDMN